MYRRQAGGWINIRVREEDRDDLKVTRLPNRASYVSPQVLACGDISTIIRNRA